jgi:hypothetical protein
MHSFPSEIYFLKSLKLNYIEIDEEILQKTVSVDEKNLYKQRFIIKINDSESWQAGVVALGNGKGYITVKNAFLKKYRLQLGDLVQVHLQKDESEFGMKVSDELKEVLFQDPAGEHRFNLLPMGKKRYIIYYVNQVKSSQKRIERSLLLIGNLKKTEIGKEEFRFLLGKD